MKRIASAVFGLLFVFTLVAPSLEASAIGATSSISDEEILAYLDAFSFETTNTNGDPIFLSYNTDSLSLEQLDYIVNYIRAVGIAQFEAETVSSFSAPTITRTSSISARAAVSEYVVFPENGTQTYENTEYMLVSMEDGHTLEYLEVISITVECRDNIVTGINRFNFTIESMGAGGSYETNSFQPGYSSNSASLSVNYTLTFTVEVGVGDFSFPIIECSSLQTAYLLLLRSSA